MKKFSIVFGSTLICMIAAVLLSSITSDNISRYHQHLQQPRAKECTDNSHKFCTNLPIVSIETDGVKPIILQVERDGKHDAQSTVADCSIEVFDQETGENSLKDTPSIKSFGKIQYRGNSSIYFDKKSYKLNLINEDNTENKENRFLGMSAHDEWVLNGPFLDKTLLRNYLCFNISGEIMQNTSEVRFCEIFLNGEYQGVYLALESISYREDRLELTKYKEGDNFTSYIIRADRDKSQPYQLNDFMKYVGKIRNNTSYEILYPPASKLNSEIVRYIEEDISVIQKMLYSFDYDDRVLGSKSQMDINSFVDYFIINEFFQNYDAGIYSTYFYKDVKEKLSIGPVWDFNNSCNNYMEVSRDETGFQMHNYSWFFMLSKDDSFTKLVIKRYRELRKTVLSETYLLDYIDKTVSWLGEAVDRNYEIWGYSFDVAALDDYNKLSPDDRNLKSYDDAVLQLKNFLIKRGNWLDKNIDILKQYSHESQVKKFNH